MWYGATPRIFADDDLAMTGCTSCNWVSKELPAQAASATACGKCGADVDRYIVYADFERRRARYWMRNRFRAACR